MAEGTVTIRRVVDGDGRVQVPPNARLAFDRFEQTGDPYFAPVGDPANFTAIRALVPVTVTYWATATQTKTAATVALLLNNVVVPTGTLGGGSGAMVGMGALTLAAGDVLEFMNISPSLMIAEAAFGDNGGGGGASCLFSSVSCRPCIETIVITIGAFSS